ncbi:MAG: metallophosphoesterase [Bacteroidota bacterium]
METLETEERKPSARKGIRFSTARYYFEKGLMAVQDLLPDDSFWFKNYFIELNEFFLAGADKQKPHIKLVQFSDLHLKTISGRLKQTVAKVNSMQPDLIFFTGDSVDNTVYLPVFENFMQLFDKRVQKIAILGNWEIHGGVDVKRLRKIYTDNNCLLFINATRQFTFKNKTVSITGIDDSYAGNADFQAAVKDYKKSDYHIVLSHCPEHRDIISTQLTDQIPVDFILSGHTHGGQLNFLGLTPQLPIGSGNYLSGWYNHTAPPLYVSKGLGTSILPLRLGCKAEIAVFNLEA